MYALRQEQVQGVVAACRRAQGLARRVAAALDAAGLGDVVREVAGALDATGCPGVFVSIGVDGARRRAL